MRLTVPKTGAGSGAEVIQAQKALSLAESRYKAGADNLQTLLDVQRVAYQSRDSPFSCGRSAFRRVLRFTGPRRWLRRTPEGPEG
jgi:hypothetical protein